jgi:hypothetical protein
MADLFPRDRPHLYIAGGGELELYRRPGFKIDPPPLPQRDRKRHAAALEAAIGEAIAGARRQLAARNSSLATGTPGYYLEVQIATGQRGTIDQLSDRRKKVEVLTVRQAESGESILAAIFVPATAEGHYLAKVRAYRDSDTSKGRPRHESLVASMETARLGTARSLFTDEIRHFPIDPGEEIWWEVWLRKDHREAFERVARALGFGLQPQAVRFPEREVVLARTNSTKLDRLLAHSDVVAELRRAKDSPAFFLRLSSLDQRAWSDDARSRLTLPAAGSAVAVCLLDSGVRRQHPLIEPLLSADDWHTIDPNWGPDDTAAWHGHGTLMAGVALYGDLIPALAGSDPIGPPFIFESVRILPPADQANDPLLYGAITGEAIARAEIQAPFRKRVSVCAVTSAENSRGRPSSWSAAVDQLCFEESNRRLIIFSAGNILSDLLPVDHLIRNDVETADNPAQSWNALVVGAFTDRVAITDPTYAGWRPIAPARELSPRSRTSVTWDGQWPIRPDVVFEGGNLAHDGRNPGEPIDDLQLLTTFFRPDIRLFATLGDTSAAAALVANLAGTILAERPQAWPETLRGIIVHSAEWTPPMWQHIDACNGHKAQIVRLLRRYGYGVPDLSRALRSARNDLTLLVEDELQPFERERDHDGSPSRSMAKMREMKIHSLPWPREELERLGPVPVELRATLSYFIEPNPGERGWTRKHRYASHGLRFQVKRATESLREFRARINLLARDEEEGISRQPIDDGWLIGPRARDVGSIHSDLWQGTAADLATRDAIGVYPIGGWWKEKVYLERAEAAARYSLIVTLRAPGIEVDIYTPVETQIAISTEA